MSSLELAFASLLAYHPRGVSAQSQDSRKLTYAIKQGKSGMIPKAVNYVLRAHAENAFPGFFGPDVVAVPVPRSAPLVKGALWPSDVISRELLIQGLVGSVSPLLSRVRSVRASHLHKGTGRASPQDHIDSIRAEVDFETDKILLVDDVVTRGSTLMGSYSVVTTQQAFWADIRAFAMVRTTSFGSDVVQILDPITGTITWTPGGNWLVREP